MKTIYLAGGCFWGLGEYFSRILGVLQVTVGYADVYKRQGKGLMKQPVARNAGN